MILLVLTALVISSSSVVSINEDEIVTDSKSESTTESNVRAVSDSRVEYAIIADESFYDELTPLADWKTRKGVAAKIYKLQDIYSSFTGVDKAQQIHNFLRDLDGKSSYLQWVLLAGDADGDTNADNVSPPHVPSRLLYSGGGSSGVNDYYWSDAYYAGLSHGWNLDGDGNWGEIDVNHWSNEGSGTSGEESDLDFEVYVGRLPGDTEAEITTMVSKILTYEKNPPSGDWAKTVLLWGGLMDAPNIPEYDPDMHNAYEVKHDLVKPIIPPHMIIKELYDYPQLEGGSYTSATDDLNPTNAVNSFDAGSTFVNFAGQSYYDGWALIDYNDPTGLKRIGESGAFRGFYWYTDGENAVNGYMLPLVYMSGCDAAVFNFSGAKEDRSQERMLTNPNGGAIGLISSTAHTYRGEENHRHEGNWWLDEHFFKLMFQNGYYQPGKALYELKEKTVTDIEGGDGGNRISAVRSNTYGYILLGDPELTIWTDVPRLMDVDVDGLYVGPGEAVITAADPISHEPIEGAFVNIMNTEMYLQGYTNETGVCTIPINPLNVDTVDIIVTAHNYIPKEIQDNIELKPVDLKVDAAEMWFDIETPLDGMDLTVFARVYNDGGTDLSVPATAEFYLDAPGIGGSKIGTDQTVASGLETGKYETLSVTWKVSYRPEPYKVYINVDPNDNLDEYKEDNNIAYITTSVLGSDLKIGSGDINLSPGTLVGETQDITLNLTVHNIGKVNAKDVLVKLYDGEPSSINEITTISGSDITISTVYKNSSTYTAAQFNLDGGSHDLHVWVDAENDTYEMNEGNNIASKSLYVNYAPEIKDLSAVTLFEDEPVEKQFDLHEMKYSYDHDNDTAELRYSVKSIEPPGNLSVTISENRYVNIFPAENWSSYESVEVTISVTDGLSTDTDTFEVIVKAEDDAPSIEPLGKITGKSNKDLNIQINASDSDGDSLLYYDDSIFFDINIYSGKINFTANDTMIGTHQITITVTDGDFNTKMTFELEILPRDNHPPELETIPDINAVVGKPFKIILRATDPDGDDLQFFADPPLFFEIEKISPFSAELKFEPNKNDVMDQEVIISVFDGVDSDEQKVRVVIKEKEEDTGTSLGLNTVLLAGIVIPIIVIIVVFFLFKRKKQQDDRDMKAWEMMDSMDRPERRKDVVKEIAEVGDGRSLIEEELLSKELDRRQERFQRKRRETLTEDVKKPKIKPVKRTKILKKVPKELPPKEE